MGDGAWWWHPTAELLAERGVSSEAPALPSCGETGQIDPDGGTFTVRSDLLADTFLQDCEAEIQRRALDRLARQSLAVLEQPVRTAAWRHVDSTYLVCAQDLGTPPQRQREFAERAGRVVELEAGHHPFLSQPAAVRDLVLGL